MMRAALPVSLLLLTMVGAVALPAGGTAPEAEAPRSGDLLAFAGEYCIIGFVPVCHPTGGNMTFVETEDQLRVTLNDLRPIRISTSLNPYADCSETKDAPLETRYAGTVMDEGCGWFTLEKEWLTDDLCQVSLVLRGDWLILIEVDAVGTCSG